MIHVKLAPPTLSVPLPSYKSQRNSIWRGKVQFIGIS